MERDLRARQAKDLLASDLWEETTSRLREILMREIEHSDPGDPDTRENAYYNLQALRRLEMVLRSWVDDQKIRSLPRPH